VNERGQYGDRGRSLYGRAALRTSIGLSPEPLKEDLERLDGEIRSLQEKISAQRVEMVMQAPGQLRQAPLEIFFQKRWTPFYSSWRHYYDQLRGMDVMGWLGMAKIIEKALSDWQNKLIGLRVDASLAGLRTNGSRSSEVPAPAPAPAPAPTPGPAAAPMPGPSPERPADQAGEKDSNTVLYVALGIGVVVMAAAAMAVRHAGAA
jgi:hypothetical protein